MDNVVYLVVFCIGFFVSFYYLQKFSKIEDKGGIVGASCGIIVNFIGWLITIVEMLGGI